MKRFVITYVLLMPFMSALAPVDFLPLPLLFLMVIAPFVLERGLLVGADLDYDAGFLLTYALGCVALIASPIVMGQKNLNYAAAVFVSYLMFFVVVRTWFRLRIVSWQLICMAARICLTVLSLAIITEWYLASFHGVFFSDLIPFAHGNLNIADLVNSDFKRPRAFAPEPAFTALAFECLWPLALAELGGWRLRWLWALYGCAFLMLASAAAIFSLVIALLVVWAVRDRKVKRWSQLLVGTLVVVVATIITDVGQEVVWSIFGRKLDILWGVSISSEAEVSVTDRLSTFDTGLKLLQFNPFGIGWGTLGQAFFSDTALPDVDRLGGSGLLSLYLDVAVAAGLLGLMGFLYFLGRRVVAVLKSNHPLAKYLSISLISLCVHHSMITEFQFPFIWFSLSLVDKMTRGVNQSD